MKKYKIEQEHGIDYVVIHLDDNELMDLKKIIKQNFDFLKNPNFKFFISDSKEDWLVFYTKKYKTHNPYGPSWYLLKDDMEKFHLDGIEYEFEQYINNIRKKILGEILDENKLI